MPISFERRPHVSIGIVQIALVLAGCSAASTRPSFLDDQKSLLALQDQWAAARVRRDVPFLEHLYAKEFRVTSLSGAVVDRAADIANFASGDLKPEQVSDDEMTATVYGDTGLVTGREFMKGSYKGRFGEFIVRFTNVYVRRDGRWQRVTHQATQISKK
jgi:ketosteroid isomerase-like protein